MRFVTAAVGLSAVLMLGACATPAVAPVPEVTAPAPVESPEPAFENRSEPFGSWKLEPGIPENTPADVPFPEGRWIEESSVAFNAEQDRALNFIFNPERDDRDSRLTVTYVASVRG